MPLKRNNDANFIDAEQTVTRNKRITAAAVRWQKTNAHPKQSEFGAAFCLSPTHVGDDKLDLSGDMSPTHVSDDKLDLSGDMSPTHVGDDKLDLSRDALPTHVGGIANSIKTEPFFW